MAESRLKFDCGELNYLIWLQAVVGIGNRKVKPILEHFGSAENVYNSSKETLKSCGLFSARQLELSEKTDISYSDKVISDCKKSGIGAIGLGDSRFPKCLEVLDDPPLVLYFKGKLPDFDNDPVFCIIGPRKISDFGMKAAYSLSARLSKAGMIILSGGAMGGDSFAHKGAIKYSGTTVAVLPCGIDFDYLSENRPLRDEILKSGGALISESPPKAGLLKHAFPVRNRLLSALSLGVAIVESPERSGTLITAHHALDQGKDVFVVPGNPTLACYKGSNDLLRDGAKPLIDASDIFNEYIPIFAHKLDLERAFEKESENKEKKILKKSANGLSKEAKIVYNSLNKPKFTADDINADGVSDDELLAALTELEMEQFIEALPGGYYTLI